MTLPIEALETEVLGLGATDRSRLLDKQIASLDRDTAVEAAWLAEARRRDDEIETGHTQVLAGASVVAGLRAGLR